MQRLCFFLFSLTCVCFPLGVTIPSRAVYVSHVAREKRNDETTEEERCGTQSPSPGGWGNVCQTGKWGWDFLEFQSEYYFFNGRKPWYISGFFLPLGSGLKILNPDAASNNCQQPLMPWPLQTLWRRQHTLGNELGNLGPASDISQRNTAELWSHYGDHHGKVGTC